MLGNPFTWYGLGLWAQFGAAFAAVIMAVWLGKLRPSPPQRGALIALMVLSAAWSLVSIGFAGDELPVQIAETLRNLALLWLIYRLIPKGDAAEGVVQGAMRGAAPVLVALALVEIFQPVFQLVLTGFADSPSVSRTAFSLSMQFRLLAAIGVLVLVHNLYVAAETARSASLRWTATAFALLFAYELNLFTVSWLGGEIPVELAAPRGLIQIGFIVLLAIGCMQVRSAQRFSPSRTVAFQSLSLLIIGAYLVVMMAVAQSLSLFGGNGALLTQLGFALLTSVLALAILPSGRLRGWLKVNLAKHFFQHRYDYRAEWLRFTRTIGRGGADAPPLHERIVQALADITDSPAGLLLTPTDIGSFALAARWQWDTVEVPAEALSADAAAFLARENLIIDLGELRAGLVHRGEDTLIPDWLREDARAWVVVPLHHFEKLAGVVVLARPAVLRRLDWEDFDLLKVVGQQLASYLAEQAGQEALLDASRFDEFHRRIAFVMHDIKNLASQLGLLARNAERHAENPAFRADMLVTLRNSADKLNALIARLSRYGASPVDEIGVVDLRTVAQRVVAQFGMNGRHPVYLGAGREISVLAHAPTLEQVLIHLVQNAVDASDAADPPVALRVGKDDTTGWIEVADSGCGMTADFVRNRLFKPFVSTKSGGFGIGAFEARELVRAMRGELQVESREGLGSRFRVHLPLAVNAPLPHGQEAEVRQNDGLSHCEVS